MKLWLDDVRDPVAFGLVDWHWARTADEAIELLRNYHVSIASLDHDLGGGPFIEKDKDGKTGYDVLCWLEQHPEFWPERVSVHSMNPAGRQRMQQVIDKHEGRL